MSLKLFSFIFCLLFSSIFTIENQIVQIEKDQELQFKMKSKTMYIATKNTINGIYNYDFVSPKTLNVTFAKFDSIDIDVEQRLNEFEGHNETSNRSNDILVSITVKVNNDNKYTFLKVENLDYDSDEIKIDVKLSVEYTWAIVLIFILVFGTAILCIFLTCFCSKNCLTKCCNFQELYFN